MEPVENLMVMPEYEYKSNCMPDDVWAEKEDRDYEDSIFKEESYEEKTSKCIALHSNGSKCVRRKDNMEEKFEELKKRGEAIGMLLDMMAESGDPRFVFVKK